MEIRHVVEFQEGGVDRISQETWGWSIEENNAQMGLAIGALTSFIRRIERNKLSPWFIHFIKVDLFLYDAYSIIDGSPE